MKVDDQLLDHLCDLSRLSLQGPERVQLLSDLQRILDFVEKISELPLEHIEPLLFVGEPAGHLRDDAPESPTQTPLYAQNAPLHDGLYWRVPKFGVKDT
jgi:aspartyl-tRNA(Asn)/glutamyl-tRNA(Gln) amidotransferase subunit C